MPAPRMPEFINIPEAKEIPSGKGATVEVNGARIAVYNLAGTYFAMDDTCPHVGAPLGGGWVEGETVACPMHGWEFEIKTGRCITVPRCAVSSYPMRIENGEVQICID